MNKPITVKAHLSLEELESRYRKAKEPVARSHWQIIWLVAQGEPAHQVAEVTSYSYDWVRCIVRRYNQEGPPALGARRRYNPGGSFILSAEQQAQLQRVRDEPPADGGLWSGPKVARWIEEQTGRKVHPQRGWEYLKRMGRSLRIPRPRHAKADLAAQEAFKKTFPSS